MTLSSADPETVEYQRDRDAYDDDLGRWLDEHYVIAHEPMSVTLLPEDPDTGTYRLAYGR